MHTTEKYRWTAIFLIRGSKGMVDAMIQVVNQLLQVEKTNAVAVILCIKIQAENIPQHFPRKRDGVQEGWTTLFYMLASTEAGCFLQLITENANFDIRKQSDVSGFFQKNVLSNALANEYMIFTWDHGQPFGVFAGGEEELRTPTELDNDALTKKIKSETSPLLFHFKIWERLQQEINAERIEVDSLTDLPNQEFLNIFTITELKNAIQWAFGDKKIGIIVMANCNLQFFDTGYELSACAQYLVAFETEFYFKNSFDYKTIIERASGVAASSEMLAKLAVTTFGMETDKESEVMKNSVALFANNLSHYPQMAELIGSLAEALANLLPDNFEKIKDAVNSCGYITPNIPEYCLIDFRKFIVNLNRFVPEAFHLISYQLFISILDSIVIESFVGAEFLKNDASLISPSCFSVYLPKEPGDYQTSFLDNYMQNTSLSATEFARLFKWEFFIKKFMECFPQ